METLLLDRMQSLTELVALSCAMESCVCHANASGDVTVEIGDRLGPPVRAGAGRGGCRTESPFPFGQFICILDFHLIIHLKKVSMENYKNNIPIPPHQTSSLKLNG